MPVVNGIKYPYTKAGQAQAKAAKMASKKSRDTAVHKKTTPKIRKKI